ncbi:MAG: DUF1579 domain-containing protein [Planctomycetota bacterium]|nr:MAG: DUF1579 domain-containing protein [Planctomycetota bacterium]
MSRFAICFAVSLVAWSCAWAQVPEFPQPQQEHKWLAQLVGDWEVEAEMTMGPGQPAMQCTGTIETRKLGGFWVVSEVTNEMMGMKITALQTIGYDAQAKQFVGTWVDSMTDILWQYEGTLDATGKILTLEAEGPNMLTPGKTAKFRDIYEIKGPDEILTRSQMQTEDGEWMTFGTGVAKRKE